MAHRVSGIRRATNSEFAVSCVTDSAFTIRRDQGLSLKEKLK